MRWLGRSILGRSASIGPHVAEVILGGAVLSRESMVLSCCASDAFLGVWESTAEGVYPVAKEGLCAVIEGFCAVAEDGICVAAGLTEV